MYLAGQVSGVEGYVESAACGLMLGVLLAVGDHVGTDAVPPPSTALGALLGHLRDTEKKDFQPSNVVWSMFPPIDAPKKRVGKRERRELMAQRALADLEPWLDAVGARIVRAQVEGTAARVETEVETETEGALA